MPHPIALRELLKNSQLKSLLEDLINLINRPIFIEELDGNLLLGQPATSISREEYVITVNQEDYGVVKGDSSAQIIARLIAYCLNQETFVLFDDLTKIPNRRYFDLCFQQEWRRCQRQNHFLCLLICDLDHFKSYNDYYGHTIGDRCLTQVAQILRETLKRPADEAFRYGGEEFVLILPNTSSEGGQMIAREIVNHIQQAHIPHYLSPINSFVTISVGISATIPRSEIHPDTLLQAADIALYRAKRTGRNRYSLQEIGDNFID